VYTLADCRPSPRQEREREYNNNILPTEVAGRPPPPQSSVSNRLSARPATCAPTNHLLSGTYHTHDTCPSRLSQHRLLDCRTTDIAVDHSELLVNLFFFSVRPCRRRRRRHLRRCFLHRSTCRTRTPVGDQHITTVYNIIINQRIRGHSIS